MPILTQEEEAVVKGVAFLTKKEPGWYSRIDLDILDLRHPDYCVLGQIFGTYVTGIEHLDIWSSDYVVEYGFEPDHSETPDHLLYMDWNKLEAVWRRVIQSLQENTNNQYSISDS